VTDSVQTRSAWADVCRSFAIYGVVLIHSCGAFFYQYGKLTDIEWLSANFLDSLVRCSVPLFVMLSGAMLLKKNAPIHTFPELLKRIIKVLMPLVFWSAAYLLLLSKQSGNPIAWASVLTQPAMYHLWFVYMIIGLYIILPMLQAIFNILISRRDLQLYFLALWIIITSIPTYYPIPLLNLLQQNYLFGYGGYFLIGGVIASLPRDRLSSFLWGCIFFGGIMTTFLLTWFLSRQTGIATETAYIYFAPNVFLASVSAFVLFTRVAVSTFYSNIYRWLGDRSFIIFFVHVIVLEQVRYSGIILKAAESIPTFFLIIFISSITFLLSLLVAAALRLIPGAHRVVG
jgi:surface polysaccharide O-acyltransferase-like enzyme